MIVALIDNGSLEPAAHRNLRALASSLSARAGVKVHPVSWKHSERIEAVSLGGIPADTLAPWVRTQVDAGERDFVFIPFFVSAQGAIGSWLRRDLESLQREIAGGFRFTFSAGLADQGALARIVVLRILETIATRGLATPPVIVVDHGGPSTASAQLRDRLAAEVRDGLGSAVGGVLAASLEGADHPHNLPLFVDALVQPGFDRGDVIVAPLFLAPGRHAGAHGDLALIAAAAEDRGASAGPALARGLRCHFTALPGTHPQVADALAAALTTTLSTLHIAA
ncbi:MAG TPA: hypothetical protein VHE61_20685 [Opitutaceae bacterium]|nr:hypothetical protein [Opitutaceae bacterium]